MYNKYLQLQEEYDAIIPVPMHINRLRKRKYNHAELLLERFIEEGCPVETHALTRAIDTPHQSMLNKDERISNLSKAFVADRDKVRGKKILLIDDVYTTGTTINECARALLKKGATSVSSLTLCRAPEWE